jgi:hypothetical protein
MTAATALRLARSSSRSERCRRALIAGSVAVAGSLLLYVIHLGRAGSSWDSGLARYVTEDGLRIGVATAAVLLAVPVLALTAQALRMGSVDRDRRVAALRLAGATPNDVRVVAAVEGVRAAAVGGVLAGPAYVVLWVFAGVLPSWGWRLVERPDALDALAWLLLVPVLAAAGGAAAGVLRERDAQSAGPGRVNLGFLLGGVALIVVSGALSMTSFSEVPTLLAILGLLVTAFASGPRLVLGCAALLARRPGPEALLAARRLRADPRSPGRAASALVVVGVCLGIEGLIVLMSVVDDIGVSDDAAFYFGGYALAGTVILFGAAVAVVTLLLGIADGLLAARRPLAALGVFGLDERGLARVLLRQQLATAVPAVVLGALLGPMVLTTLWWAPGWSLFSLYGLGAGTAAALVAGLALTLVAVLAVRVLRPFVRAAIDPENLRAA